MEASRNISRILRARALGMKLRTSGFADKALKLKLHRLQQSKNQNKCVKSQGEEIRDFRLASSAYTSKAIPVPIRSMQLRTYRSSTQVNATDSRKRRISHAISRIKKEQVYKSVPTEHSSKKSKGNSQKCNLKQHNSASCRLGIGEPEKVSDALGLTRSFLNRAISLPEDIFCHRGLKGFAVIFIESAFYDIEEEPLKEKLSEELLKQIGFTNPQVINTITRRSEKMRYYLDPVDFLKRFIKDEFQYNPALVAEYAIEDHRIPDDAEVLRFADYRHDQQNEHCEVRLFHGTDLRSAIDIMKNGIELDFGRHKHDFSDGGGFYLTTFEHAKIWARSQSRKPVVLELKIPKTCLEKARILKLDVSSKEGRSEWERVVREHRSGRPSKKLQQLIKEYECIEGPISVSSLALDAASTTFRPEPGSYQLCVVKRSFAKDIANNAKYTLYRDLCSVVEGCPSSRTRSSAMKDDFPLQIY